MGPAHLPHNLSASYMGEDHNLKRHYLVEISAFCILDSVSGKPNGKGDLIIQ